MCVCLCGGVWVEVCICVGCVYVGGMYIGVCGGLCVVGCVCVCL